LAKGPAFATVDKSKDKILKTAFLSNLRCGQATKCKPSIVVIFWKYYSKKSRMKVSKINLKEELDKNSS